MRKGFEKGGYPLCREMEDVLRILLKCSEIRKWREQFFFVENGLLLMKR
jgi:hypothetical protein